jgi:H+/Cl- antiporter ClcA
VPDRVIGALERLRHFIRYRIQEILHARESRETASLVLTAVLVGVLVGFAAVGFDAMVEASSTRIADLRLEGGFLRRIAVTLLAPALGGLLITPIVLVWAKDARGPGVSGGMLAVSNPGGRGPKPAAAPAANVGAAPNVPRNAPVR